MGGIVFHLSILLIGLAGLMLLPVLSALAVEADALAGLFLVSGLVVAVVSGGLIAALRGLIRPLERMHSLLVAVAAWPVIAAAAALPIVMSGASGFGLAIFETISALTTTGFTTFAAPEELPAPLILWRAVLQWYGGFLTLLMLVLVLAPVEAGGLPHRRVSLATGDLPRRRVRIGRQVRIILAAYLITSSVCLLWLVLSGVEPFEALCLSFATVSTGGLTPRGEPLDFYVPAVGQIGLIVFMIVGATSVLWQGMIVQRDRHQLRRHRESYAVIVVAVALGLVIAELYHLAAGRDLSAFGIALREGLFAGASLVSTTGFHVREESLSVLPLAAVFAVALIGGGAMSTSGGLKLFRVGVLMVHAERELARSLFPHGVQKMRFGGREWRGGVQAIYTMVLSAILVLTAAILVLSFSGMAFAPAITAGVAALSNVGPIYGAGPDPAAPWPALSALPAPALVMLAAAMVLGRVEVLALFAVVNIAYWRRR
jgi:trk system potassium uptake protein TrkH